MKTKLSSLMNVEITRRKWDKNVMAANRNTSSTNHKLWTSKEEKKTQAVKLHGATIVKL